MATSAKQGDSERNRTILAKELLAGGYPRIVVRSDGEPVMLSHVKSARAVVQVGDLPLEVVQEQVSEGRAPVMALQRVL